MPQIHQACLVPTVFPYFAFEVGDLQPEVYHLWIAKLLLNWKWLLQKLEWILMALTQVCCSHLQQCQHDMHGQYAWPMLLVLFELWIGAYVQWEESYWRNKFSNKIGD